MVEVTDEFGHVESEMATVERWDDSPVVRVQLEGKSIVFPDGIPDIEDGRQAA